MNLELISDGRLLLYPPSGNHSQSGRRRTNRDLCALYRGITGLEPVLSYPCALLVACQRLTRKAKNAARSVPAKTRQSADRRFCDPFSTPAQSHRSSTARCRITAVNAAGIDIDDIDAFDGSPVIDIKAFFPHDADDIPVRFPDWK